VAWFTPTLPGVGRIESQGDEPALRHCLCIQARRLLLHCTKGTADSNGGQAFIATVLRLVEVGGQGDAVAVFELNLLMSHLVTLRKSLVPCGFILCVGEAGRG